MVVGSLKLRNVSYFHKCLEDNKKILLGKEGAASISLHGIS